MFKCKLIKVKSDPGGLRTDEVIGSAAKVPEVGFVFQMMSKPLTEGTDVRFIETNIVKDVKKDGNSYLFRTNSESVYKLEIEY